MIDCLNELKQLPRMSVIRIVIAFVLSSALVLDGKQSPLLRPRDLRAHVGSGP